MFRSFQQIFCIHLKFGYSGSWTFPLLLHYWKQLLANRVWVSRLIQINELSRFCQSWNQLLRSCRGSGTFRSINSGITARLPLIFKMVGHILFEMLRFKIFSVWCPDLFPFCRNLPFEINLWYCVGAFTAICLTKESSDLLGKSWSKVSIQNGQTFACVISFNFQAGV